MSKRTTSSIAASAFIPKWILQQTHKAVSAIKFFLIVLTYHGEGTARVVLLCMEIACFLRLDSCQIHKIDSLMLLERCWRSRVCVARITPLSLNGFAAGKWLRVDSHNFTPAHAKTSQFNKTFLFRSLRWVARMKPKRHHNYDVFSPFFSGSHHKFFGAHVNEHCCGVDWVRIREWKGLKVVMRWAWLPS